MPLVDLQLTSAAKSNFRLSKSAQLAEVEWEMFTSTSMDDSKHSTHSYAGVAPQHPPRRRPSPNLDRSPQRCNTTAEHQIPQANLRTANLRLKS